MGKIWSGIINNLSQHPISDLIVYNKALLDKCIF